MPKKAPEPAVPGDWHAPGGVTSVDRALALLGAFTVAAPQRSLTELAEHTQQYKSTVLRMLASLEHADLVWRHADGRFSLGQAVPRLGAVFAATFTLGDLVQPILSALVAGTRESASYHVAQGTQDLCLYRHDSPQPMRDHLRAGDLQPMARSVAGRVMLAYREPADGAPGDEAGRSGGASRAARIRRDQLLLSKGDIVPELAAIAVPVLAADQRLLGVLALCMPAVRFEPGHAPLLQAAAVRLAGQIRGLDDVPRHQGQPSLNPAQPPLNYRTSF